MGVSEYPKILSSLSGLSSKEKFPRCLDNIAAACSRLVLTSMGNVPLNVVST